MALANVVGAASRDAADPLIGRDLVEPFRQHASPVRSNRWHFTGSTSLLVNATARISSVFVDAEVNLAPHTTLGVAMPAGIPPLP